MRKITNVHFEGRSRGTGTASIAAIADARRASQDFSAARSLPQRGVNSFADKERSGKDTGGSQGLRASAGISALANSVRRIGLPSEELVVEQP